MTLREVRRVVGRGSDGGGGGADLARRAGRPGADLVAAGAVGQATLDAERATGRLGLRVRLDGERAVAADRHLPGHAVAVLVDLELRLQAPVVRLDLELRSGAVRALARDAGR